MNKSLRTLVFINLIFVFGATLLGPLYAIFIKEIGGDILTMGLAFAVYMFTVGLISYAAGRLGDKMKETEYLIAAGYLIRAIGFFLYTLIGTPGQLLVLQFFLGIGEAIANPAFKSVYSLHLNKNRFATEWGIWDMFYSVMVGAAAITGALLVKYLGFNILFFVMSAISLLAFILLILQPRKLL